MGHSPFSIGSQPPSAQWATTLLTQGSSHLFILYFILLFSFIYIACDSLLPFFSSYLSFFRLLSI